MAADSLKDKNMPTISENIYSGLQKWVNRASQSLRGRPRMRSRFNSDLAGMTLYKKKTLENMAKQPGTHDRVVVHGRSRSNPIPMPDETVNFEGDYPKIAQVPTSKQATFRKQSSELSDDSSSQGSYKERRMSLLKQRLSQNLSKSESCLVDVNESHERKQRSRSHNSRNTDRRRNSSDTDGTLDSNSSEIDINDNRKPRTSRSLTKTNKPDRSHSTEPKVDSMGANKNELSPRDLERKSKEIHSRLDKWMEKSAFFKDSRQSSYESTSSSDEIFYNEPKKLNETQHFRDLQTAIHELVSSCGRHSTTNTTNGETVETKTKRKISLKDAGPMFNKAVEIDSGCLQDKQQGASVEDNSSKSIPEGERKDENCYLETNDGNGNSFDNVDGHGKIRDAILVGESFKADNHNSVSDIGPDSDITRALNDNHNHALHDAKTKHSTTQEDTNLMEGKMTNDQELQNTNFQSKLDQQTSSSHEHNETICKSLEGNVMPLPPKSHKNFHAPSPPAKRSGEKTSKADPKVPVFDDADLTAFAMTCVQHASKKKTSLEKNERESKSDSDEEKKKVDLDFVYLPRNREVIKSSPKTTSHEKELLRAECSDDDTFSASPSQLRNKRGSADSLDGFVLFDSVPVKADSDDNRYLSANEEENSNKPEKTPRRGSGLKKFPSMPLFYVPKDFDGNGGGGEARQVKSLGKSLWKRIKSIPRSNDNQKTKQSSSSVQSDPFYHGEKEDESVPTMRPKSNSVGARNSRRRRRRLSLDASNVSKPSVTITQPSEDHTLDDETVVNTPPLPDESQC